MRWTGARGAFARAPTLVASAVAVGAWWFGSGMYGELPEIVVPQQ
ncbi:hypothetical protein [Corynebacterium jeddahense]|nr:hypothetical protein [Corynebacterium jeddahense]